MRTSDVHARGPFWLEAAARHAASFVMRGGFGGLKAAQFSEGECVVVVDSVDERIPVCRLPRAPTWRRCSRASWCACVAASIAPARRPPQRAFDFEAA